MALYVNAENQKLLWNIINKHPIINEYFLNKPIENKSYWFQSCIQYIYVNIQSENLSMHTLQDYNKETLRFMLNNIKESYKNEFTNQTKTDIIPPIKENIENKLSKNELINQNFSIRQKEYENMLEKKIPDSIDFRDKMNDEPISNMDEILQTHLKMRENELKQYTPIPLTSESEKEDSKISISGINEIEIMKKQIRDLIKKTDKMQEEIDVLKYGK